MNLSIGQLSCAGAAAPLARRIEQLPGVREATVNPITERAVIFFDPAVIDVAGIVRALRQDEGIEVSGAFTTGLS